LALDGAAARIGNRIPEMPIGETRDVAEKRTFHLRVLAIKLGLTGAEYIRGVEGQHRSNGGRRATNRGNGS
jgi:hypothetical protein